MRAVVAAKISWSTCGNADADCRSLPMLTKNNDKDLRHRQRYLAGAGSFNTISSFWREIGICELRFYLAGAAILAGTRNMMYSHHVMSLDLDLDGGWRMNHDDDDPPPPPPIIISMHHLPITMAVAGH